ncbi:CsbD family protein [Marinobacter sp. GN3S48]
MSKNPVKGGANEEKEKAKETDDENTENKGKARKRGDKDDTVLGDVNDEQ